VGFKRDSDSNRIVGQNMHELRTKSQLISLSSITWYWWTNTRKTWLFHIVSWCIQSITLFSKKRLIIVVIIH